MTSKYQKKPFPIENLAKTTKLTVHDQEGRFIDINYSELKLIFTNGQLCFFYELENLIIPIYRRTTIDELIQRYIENVNQLR